MQFMLFCCIDENDWHNLPEAQRGQIMEQYGEWVGTLKRDGRLLAGAKLDDSSRAVTVRQRAGKPDITDGPYAETKEQLGGYHLLECRDRAEAIALAQKIPTLPFGGTIEVRAVVQSE
jgi:hypothetical protein